MLRREERYAIDTSRDIIALGICDLASGINRGFVVSGADSRTAFTVRAGVKAFLETEQRASQYGGARS